MGQQETVTVAGSALRRMILVLAAAALMAAMMAVMAAPAFADKGGGSSGKGFGAEIRKECKESDGGIYARSHDPGSGDKEQQCILS